MEIDFTLSNAKRVYSSMGFGSGVNWLKFRKFVFRNDVLVAVSVS